MELMSHPPFFKLNKMKQLRIASLVMLIIGFMGYLLWRFILDLPDWFMRIAGIITLVSIFTLTFSTVRLKMAQNKGISQS